MKYFLIFLSFVGLLFSQTNEKIILPSFVDAKTQVVVGEIFEVQLKVIVLSDDINSINTEFENGNSYVVFNPKRRWKSVNKNTFINTYYFKLKSKQSKLPVFNIVVSIKDIVKVFDDNDLGFDNDLKAQNSYSNLILNKNIDYPDYHVIELVDVPKFSKVIASNLVVKSFISKKYDDKNNIILFDIEANLSNLGDFNLSNGGINSFVSKLFNSKLSYYVIAPNYQNQINFVYFNTNTNKFKTINLNIDVQKDTLSTQTELNPQENKYILYKKIFVVMLFFIVLIFVIIKRKLLYLIILLILLIILFYIIKPYDSVVIEGNTAVKILPTKNSTIMYTIDNQISLKKLYEQNNHTKILLPNDKIGWIKNENIIEVKSFFHIN